MIEGYKLSLSDGNDWWISADTANLPVIDKFSKILGLQKSEPNSSKKIIFSEILDDQSKDMDTYHEILKYIDNSLSIDSWTCYYDGRSLRVWKHKEKALFLCEARYRALEPYIYISLWNSMMIFYLQSILSGGIPFHASSAELNGKAVLFVAPSGIGKTTCYRRLPNYWKRLSDDENLVVLGKDKKYRIHPFPTWSEYLRNDKTNTWNSEYSAPVSAVFFLEQADFDKAIPVGKGEAAFSMYRSAIQVFRVFWCEAPEVMKVDCRRRLFMNACEMSQKLPAFLLKVSLNGKFWEEVERVIE